MGLRIQTNMQALTAQRNLTASTLANDASMEKLSSGFRINKSADDAAGLAISEKIKADIRGLNTAKRNANDGISLVQTAEGAMNEIGNILARLRELSVQGASDTIGNNERNFIHKEFVALKNEIDRISTSTEYNGTLLLVGNNAPDLPDDLTKRANGFPIEVQVGKNWFASTDSLTDAQGEFEINPTNIIRIDLGHFDTTSEGLGLGGANEQSAEATGVYLEDGEPLSTASKQRSQQSIDKLDHAINTIAGFRADLGAIQSRLGSTINNLSVQSENYSAANSRIRDTDFADETAKMTQSNILKQSGIAVLSQANQAPHAALRLLG